MKLRRWLGAMVLGAVMVGGCAAGAWGQTAHQQTGTIEEAKKLFEEAQRLVDAGRHNEAVPLIQRATAIAMNLGGEVFLKMGDKVEAEQALLSELSIRKETHGPRHPFVAMAMHNLANLYLAKGDYTQAEELILEEFVIMRQVYGDEHPNMVPVFKDLAALYQALRSYSMADTFYQFAFKIQLTTLGMEHPEVAKTLNDHGSMFLEKGDYDQAEKSLVSALSIEEKALGPVHPQVLTTLTNLARLYQAKQDEAKAKSFGQRAFRVLENLAESQPFTFFNTVENLAMVCDWNGDHAQAELLYRRVLTTRKALGDEHPTMVQPLRNLAVLHWTRGDVTAALLELDRATSIEDAAAMKALSTGSAEQRRLYTERLRLDGGIDMAISLHMQAAHEVAGAKQLAFRTILRRKGMALDALRIGFANLREGADPEDKIKFARVQQLIDLYAMSARIDEQSTDAQQVPRQILLQSLNAKRQMLENELSISRNRSQAPLKLVTVEQVQAVLPKDAALVEIFRYRPFDPKAASTKRWGEARFVAYVLHPTGKIDYADLGEAKPIEEAVKSLREALSRAATAPKSAARELHQRVITPIQKLLGQTRHIYLSPDGILSLVPFGAMMNSEGHYVAEDLAITYLTTGRDLVQTTNQKSRQPAIVFAAPDYGIPTKEVTRQFLPLRAGAQEGLEAWQKLPDAKFYDGARATEERLRSVHGPAVLHISTHGFFDKDLPAGQDQPDREPLPWEVPMPAAERALLRSGLALAGANRGVTDGGDGLLTALEASQLDLRGTKLVVLSACETGMGQAENGDGVYGLRRSFTIAGAETVVMSLWQVDASATTDLVKRYYDGLSAGGGRAEALRQAQLAMLANPETSHPYYWASFIMSGNDSSMDGRPVTPTFNRVTPGMRCGTCTVGVSDGDDVGGFLGIVVIGAICRLRRRVRCGIGF